MFDLEALKEEQLTREEIAQRLRDREDFRTVQLWGSKITNGLYATGSTGIIDDDGEPRISAIINWQNQILPATPMTNTSFYEEMLAL